MTKDKDKDKKKKPKHKEAIIVVDGFMSDSESPNAASNSTNTGKPVEDMELWMQPKTERPVASAQAKPKAKNKGFYSFKSLLSGAAKDQVSDDLELVFVEPVDRRYECPVCCEVLRYPVMFEDCNHRCCSSCLPELLRSTAMCPLDDTKVYRERVIVDKGFQREIDDLQVKCCNVKAGCKWLGALRDLLPHWEECKYTKVPCPKGCPKSIERRQISKHLDLDCSKRQIKCEFCKDEMLQEEEVDHLNTCIKFPVPCPNGCKEQEIPREKMARHLEKECVKQKGNCPFADAGCTFKGERKEIDKHIEREMADHLQKLCLFVVRQKNLLDDTYSRLDATTARMNEVLGRVGKLEKLYGAQIVWQIDNFEDKFNQARLGNKPTIFSPPFLTSRHGYKLALSLCPYGDGKVRAKFMSIFVCICKGDYDALLLWPFCHKVTFTLVDQCQDPSARRNVTGVVRPNTCKENRPFLGRPVGDRNASFGLQKLIELDTLRSCDYIREDCIFIKVDVDSEEVPML